MLGLMPCYCCLEILHNFLTRGQYLPCALGPEDYIATSTYRAVNVGFFSLADGKTEVYRVVVGKWQKEVCPPL